MFILLIARMHLVFEMSNQTLINIICVSFIFGISRYGEITNYHGIPLIMATLKPSKSLLTWYGLRIYWSTTSKLLFIISVRDFYSNKCFIDVRQITNIHVLWTPLYFNYPFPAEREKKIGKKKKKRKNSRRKTKIGQVLCFQFWFKLIL